MKKEASSHTGSNRLVRGVHARLAPFTFLANLSLLLLLARCLECLCSRSASLRELLQQFNPALNALKASFRTEFAILFLLLFIPLVLFLTVGRGRRHSHPAAGAPGAAIIDSFELSNYVFGEEYSLPNLPQNMIAPSSLNFDPAESDTYSMADRDEPMSPSSKLAAAMRASAPAQVFSKGRALELQLAGGAFSPSAPSWELIAIGSMRADNGEEKAEEKRERAAIVTVGGREMVAWAGAGQDDGRSRGKESVVSYNYEVAASSWRGGLEGLTREEANEHFSQFQARTWAKIRGESPTGPPAQLIVSSNPSTSTIMSINFLS